MTGIIETITAMDETQLYALAATIAVVISGIGNILQRIANKDKKGTINALIDFFNPYKIQTEEQTEAAKLLPGAAYKMTDKNYTRMCKELKESGAQFNERGMRDLVDKKEADKIAEYAIMVEDHDGNPLTNCKHVFVSYGVPMVLPQTDVFKMAIERHAVLTAVSN